MGGMAVRTTDMVQGDRGSVFSLLGAGNLLEI